MIRLIDADALKRRLIKRREEIASERRYGWEWEYNGLNCAILLTGCEAVENPIRPAPHWIPVTERLPKEDGDYLVTYEEGYAEDYGFDPIGIAPFEVDCEGFGIWQEHFDRYTLGSLGSDWVEIKVIAWMPLPEPYKERRTDEKKNI